MAMGADKGAGLAGVEEALDRIVELGCRLRFCRRRGEACARAASSSIIRASIRCSVVSVMLVSVLWAPRSAILTGLSE